MMLGLRLALAVLLTALLAKLWKSEAGSIDTKV
jgi:hypothetical protein